MHKARIGYCLLICSLFAFSNIASSRVNNDIVGKWTVISHEDNRPRAVVKLFYNKKDRLEGTILRVYHRAADHSHCVGCPGELENKLIDGIRFLWHMENNGGYYWSGGYILNPQTGKTYRCKMTMSDNGKSLSVRAYMGISLIGRTMTWIRRKN